MLNEQPHQSPPESTTLPTTTTTTTAQAVTQGAWVYIASTLPQRTMKQVWSAGTRLLHQGNYKVGVL